MERQDRQLRAKGPQPSRAQQIGAEFLGTALLTFVAAGADIVEHLTGVVGHTGRYIAPALIVTAMIWSLSGISGAHINESP
jgi:glycerol uptake facilitator-like aquaporin